MAKTKERLDVLLVSRGFFASRERAQAAIMSGMVWVDDRPADKAGTKVDAECTVAVKGDPLPYVSRGGLKLEHALDEFGVMVEGRTVLDAGASTGGFTDCLLQRGAAKVYAVDVGYGQLAWSLRQDPRVVNMERTNIRHLLPADLGDSPTLAVIDVAFISLAKVLPAVAALLAPAADIVALVKPQFEAGPAQVGKKGVVRDPAVHLSVLTAVCRAAADLGLTVAGLTYSPIRGPEGNIEFFLYAQKGGTAPGTDWVSQAAAVAQAAHHSL